LIKHYHFLDLLYIFVELSFAGNIDYSALGCENLPTIHTVKSLQKLKDLKNNTKYAN
jgi:hypothetical protein